jgi:class 3 adenylate cyclase/alpha-beta hydrolase superfamily lysophospholipase
VIADPPITRYATSGDDVAIAYQVVGHGPRDLVVIPGWISHLEVQWEQPLMARFLERLSGFARLILMDKRGTGLSDRVAVSDMPTLEQRMEDVRAVMDAAGSERASLLAVSEGGPLAMLLAATHPERVEALVLYGSFARWSKADDYPWAPTEEQHERGRAELRSTWGDGGNIAFFAPSLDDDPDIRSFWGRYQRQSASPNAAVALSRMATDIDVRELLPTVRVPTLVLHRTDDRVTRVGCARYLAEHIEDAHLVELPGEDHWWFAGDQDALIDEIGQFLTGEIPLREPDRVLATVLFTDIVGSTERAAQMGDQRWRELLEAHEDITRREVARHRGHTVKTLGDGALATFDGPARAVRCAAAVRDAVQRLGLELRAGVHTGEVEQIGDDVGGLAVNLGARVGALAGAGEVLASQTVKDLVVGSGIEWEERGEHTLKGIPGEWRIYAAGSG